MIKDQTPTYRTAPITIRMILVALAATTFVVRKRFTITAGFLRARAAQFAALALAAGILLAHLPSSYAKQPTLEGNLHKVSWELKKIDYYTKVDVLLQMNGPASPQMQAFLSVKEVKLKEYFPNFGIYALNLYAGWLTNLASFPEASFIALDKNVQRLGHVSETTGADEVRSNNGANAFDGNNVGIAVLDSGVDRDHKSFIQGQRNSVALGLDFTGENNTKDPFGHGTHVASSAAGTAPQIVLAPTRAPTTKLRLTVRAVQPAATQPTRLESNVTTTCLNPIWSRPVTD